MSQSNMCRLIYLLYSKQRICIRNNIRFNGVNNKEEKKTKPKVTHDVEVEIQEKSVNTFCNQKEDRIDRLFITAQYIKHLILLIWFQSIKFNFVIVPIYFGKQKIKRATRLFFAFSNRFSAIARLSSEHAKLQKSSILVLRT